MSVSLLKRLHSGVTISWTVVLWHALAWTIYISLEIILAGAISNKFAHFIDYLLHYTLYIILFYFHCYRVLIPTAQGKRIQWFLLPVKIMLELLILFCVNVLIHLWLNHLDITSTWTVSKPVFVYSNIYRGVFIIELSTLYWLGIEYINKTKRIHRIEYEAVIAEREKEKMRGDMMKAEYDLLRSRINPHMLFNALNYLYCELSKTDEPLAAHVLSLSKVMRYSLKAADDDKKIFLSDEVDHIRQYIFLHCNRIPSHIAVIEDGLPVEWQQKIIPMVLVTLAENVLKHGDLSDPKHKALIYMSNREGLLTIRTKNKVNGNRRPGHGIGLENLIKRLEMAYPGSFLFEHGRSRIYYHVQLKLTLNKPIC